MDTKAARRSFFKNKVYLSEKFDEKYIGQRFPEDIQFLLDQYIPNATFKQLSKFMVKKYHGIIKTFPEVEKALKKVLRDKLAKIPEELRKAQIQKLLSHLKEQYPNYEIQLQTDGDYKMKLKEKSGTDGLTSKRSFEDLTIFTPPKTPKFRIDYSNQKTIGNGFYKVIHDGPEHYFEVIFASTHEIYDNDEYKMQVKNGNFEREAHKIIEKFSVFIQRMERLETAQE